MKGPGKTAQFLLIVATFVVGSAWAQHEEQQPGLAAPQTNQQAEPKPGTPAPAMACCETMTSGTQAEHSMATGMMSPGMSCPHQKFAEIAGQLLTSFAAIENEKTPAALKEKLAVHGTLLKQLQATSQQTCPMMGSGMGTMHDRMMSGPKTDGPTAGTEQEKK
jgi:hypothetical protein